jgi:hypothetical protein
VQVIIRNSKSGEEYEIDSADFRRGKHFHRVVDGQVQPGQTYEEAGFKIVSLPNGEPYEGPLNEPPAERKAGD